jgi:hypothetical protein
MVDPGQCARLAERGGKNNFHVPPGAPGLFRLTGGQRRTSEEKALQHRLDDHGILPSLALHFLKSYAFTVAAGSNILLRSK